MRMFNILVFFPRSSLMNGLGSRYTSIEREMNEIHWLVNVCNWEYKHVKTIWNIQYKLYEF